MEETPKSQTSELSQPQASFSSASSFTSPILPQNLLISIKLTETNFLLWKQQVLAVIKGYGLESFLKGDQVTHDEFIHDKDSQIPHLKLSIVKTSYSLLRSNLPFPKKSWSL
ncbi:hypothetical protein C2S52_003822 [Perilla frutescens var. hirtella]|nr:hypothetical protein C2S51_011711 [Perilla frutescens var. frutescens]KAH6793345.1 hypothetical protein C2S52_003822 [Perilla frutescens var. hirtella]